MAGEIQLNSTSFASESSGTITINNATVGSSVAMAANQACVKTAINASGSAPIYACRAWINFDGSSASIGTGRANGNVSGVTDNGTGDYTVTFATAMSDANYSVAANGEVVPATRTVNVNPASTGFSTSSIRIIGVHNATDQLTDVEFVSVMIYR